MKTIITINGSKKADSTKKPTMSRVTYTNKKGITKVYEYEVNNKVEALIIPDDWELVKDDITYKKVPGYKAIASNDGRIWVWRKQKSSVKEIKYNNSNRYGYLKASVLNEKTHVSYSTTVHRVIAYTFGLIDKLEYDGNLDIDHIDNNPKNNNITNLRAIPHSENIKKRDFYGSALSKPIALFNKKTGSLELVFKSSREAAKYFSEKYETKFETACVAVCMALKGKLPTYRGYILKYLEIK